MAGIDEGEELERGQSEGTILFDGQEYHDTPRIRLLIERARAIQKQLPQVAEGYVRLWRGSRSEEEVGRNPSFTNSLVGIALPFRDEYGGPLSYVDVSKEDLDSYLDASCTAPGSEFILPNELARQAKVVKIN